MLGDEAGEARAARQAAAAEPQRHVEVDPFLAGRAVDRARRVGRPPAGCGAVGVGPGEDLLHVKVGPAAAGGGVERAAEQRGQGVSRAGRPRRPNFRAASTADQVSSGIAKHRAGVGIGPAAGGLAVGTSPGVDLPQRQPPRSHRPVLCQQAGQRRAGRTGRGGPCTGPMLTIAQRLLRSLGHRAGARPMASGRSRRGGRRPRQGSARSSNEVRSFGLRAPQCSASRLCQRRAAGQAATALCTGRG